MSKDDVNPENGTVNTSAGCNKKNVIVLALVGLLVYILIDTFTTGHVKSLLTDFLEFIEDLGFGGAVLFAVVYIVATVCLIPGSVLTLGAGFVFTKTNDGDQVAGTLIATAVVFLGASIGATIAFLFARYLLRDTAAKLTEKYKVFRAIDKAIEGNGLKIVFLLRLSPAIPFNILNYLLGTTAVTVRDYMLACFGLLPGTIAFCFIGSTLGSLTEVSSGTTQEDSSSGTAKMIILIVGAIGTVLAVVAVTVYAKKELNKHLEAAEPTEQA